MKIYLHSLKESSITYVIFYLSFLILICGICFAKLAVAVLTLPISTVILRNNKCALLRLVQSVRIWEGHNVNLGTGGVPWGRVVIFMITV